MSDLATTNDTASGTDLATLRANLPEVPAKLAEDYPALSPEIDLVEVMDGALGEGRTLRVNQLTMIKVPAFDTTGGGNHLTVPDENGIRQPRPNGLKGIPVAIDQRRSWWPTPEITNQPPSCTSRDLIHGVGEFGPGSAGNSSGLCADCPKNERGSANTGTMAAACKEQRLVFLLTDEEAFPFMIVVPAGSLKGFDQHGALLTKKLLRGPERPELGINPRTGRTWRASPWLTMEITIKLEQDTNKANQRFNKLVIAPVRRLDADEVEIVGMYGRTIDQMLAENAEAIDALNNAAVADTTGTSTRAPMPGADPGDDDVDLGDLEDETVPTGRK